MPPESNISKFIYNINNYNAKVRAQLTKGFFCGLRQLVIHPQGP